MDKNTITGLLLITAIIIVFTIYNRPSQEQIAEQQRLRDSIELIESQRLESSTKLDLQHDSAIQNENSVITQGSTVSDFFSAGSPYVDLAADSISSASGLNEIGRAHV